MRTIPVRATLTALLSVLVSIASVTDASAQGVRVIVELRLPSRHVPEGELQDAATVIGQRQAIAARTAQVLSRLTARARRAPRQFQTVPFVALEVTPEERAALALDPDVERVLDDVLLFPVLTDSVPLVEADQAWNAGLRRQRHGDRRPRHGRGQDASVPRGQGGGGSLLFEDGARRQPDAVPERARSADRSRAQRCRVR